MYLINVVQKPVGLTILWKQVRGDRLQLGFFLGTVTALMGKVRLEFAITFYMKVVNVLKY